MDNLDPLDTQHRVLLIFIVIMIVIIIISIRILFIIIAKLKTNLSPWTISILLALNADPDIFALSVVLIPGTVAKLVMILVMRMVVMVMMMTMRRRMVQMLTPATLGIPSSVANLMLVRFIDYRL